MRGCRDADVLTAEITPYEPDPDNAGEGSNVSDPRLPGVHSIYLYYERESSKKIV